MVDQTPSPSNIRNTTKAMREDPAEPLLALAVSMGPGGPGRFIEEQEAAGQAQVVNSDRLPVDGSENPGFLAVGFTFGEIDKHDKLFRPATLPHGWTRRGSDHAMWSHIIDEHGRERVAIFYKAAFYDRSAHMSLANPGSYLRSVLYEASRPVLDDTWLTAETAIDALEAIAASYDKSAVEAAELAASRPGDTYWPERADEHRASAAAARALAESLS